MAIPLNWYENFFHGVPLDLWRKAIPPEHTKAEGEFLDQALKCAPGAHLLDVPCGNGRLSFELTRRGYRVTGVDLSEEFIEEARSLVRNTGETPVPPPVPQPVPQFILGDMRGIEDEALYDGAYCFGNSFGFMVHAEMELFLGGVARALKPGARFVVETGMSAESLLPKFEAETAHQIEDIHVTIKERYLAEESCVDSEYVFERGGTIESRFAKHWIYTAAEIRRMLERAGFAIENVYGSVKSEPFVLGSQDLVMVARRR